MLIGKRDYGSMLIEIFSELNRIVSRYREDSQSTEDICFLKKEKISGTAVWVAVMIGKESDSEKKDLLNRILKDLH